MWSQNYKHHPCHAQTAVLPSRPHMTCSWHVLLYQEEEKGRAALALRRI